MQYTLNFTEQEFRNYQTMKEAYENGKILSTSHHGGYAYISILKPDEFQERLLNKVVELKAEITELRNKNWDLEIKTAGMVDKAKRRRWVL
jgi:histidinol phosphatase-like PHP family hydrolase